jgi:hypothetical protein
MEIDRNLRRHAALAVLAAMMLAATGCGGDPHGRWRPGLPWKSRGATLGNDLVRAPRGTTIEPPSLGVDIVHSPVVNPGAPLDQAAKPASSE